MITSEKVQTANDGMVSKLDYLVNLRIKSNLESRTFSITGCQETGVTSPAMRSGRRKSDQGPGSRRL